MDTNSQINDNFLSLPYVLTLRYNPNFSSPLPKLSWTDFQEHEIDFDIDSKVESLIQENLLKTINPNKKISISLSAGIDSSLIGAILRKTFPEMSIEAVSLKFDDSFDETQYASKIAEKLDFNYNVVTIHNFFEHLPEAISIVKSPFWDLHWYFLVKKASSFSQTLISGDGGDELFGGYTFRYKKFLSLISPSSTIKEKIYAYLECHERDWVPDQELIFEKKSNFSWKKIHEILEPYFNNSLPPLSQVFLADFNGKLLFNMSPIYKKIHDELKISYVAPFLSKKLISLGIHTPLKQKYDEKTNQGKIILRKLVKKYNLESLVLSEKQGFSVDTKKIWSSYGQTLCKYYLDNARIIQDHWINNQWVSKYIDNNELDYRHINKFYGLLAFEIWYRLFVTKEIQSSEKLII